MELYGKMYDLEKRLHSADQANGHLREILRKTEAEIRNLKILIQGNEKKAKEKEKKLSAQLMEALDRPKLQLSDATINTSRHSEKETELMENINQLQTQLLMEHENVLRLEVQLREQQSAREPVEPSIHVAASIMKTETYLNETEPKISNFNVKELNAMVPLSSPVSIDENPEGMS